MKNTLYISIFSVASCVVLSGAAVKAESPKQELDLGIEFINDANERQDIRAAVEDYALKKAEDKSAGRNLKRAIMSGASAKVAGLDAMSEKGKKRLGAAAYAVIKGNEALDELDEAENDEAIATLAGDNARRNAKDAVRDAAAKRLIELRDAQ